MPSPNIVRVRALRCWRRHLRPFLLIILVVTAVRSSIADWNDVPTGSMQPTILEGDRIFVNKLAYDLKVPYTTWHLAQWSDPQRGDIVVFNSPDDGTRLVKRVIGLPGDTVQMVDERLFINGQPVQYAALQDATALLAAQELPGQNEFATELLAGKPHAVMAIPAIPARRSFSPVAVPPGQYLMLGDNRDNSRDSRYFGLVNRSLIVGKATRVVVSLDLNHHYGPRWQRFFNPLQ